MRPLRSLALAVLAAFALTASSALAQAPAVETWPEITRENKPWTRWWWPGSAVDKASLTRQLEQFAAAGLGGMEITPIYGAKGAEARYVDFLSPKWMEMLEHTGREARRLGLGLDMATGTGWPFGGPWIDEAHALQRTVLKDGQLTGEPSKMMVKRAAPGGEGLVVDPFSSDALRRYLAPFDTAFEKFPRDLVRGQFHDSFEYFQASWTAKLPAVFREIHGYDLQQFAAALVARPGTPAATAVDRDTLARVKSDYRDTLARLHLDYLTTWVNWSHAKGWLVRNQSHGAPANLLDLYGAVDIPETETFGSTPFPIPGLRRNADEIRTGNEQDLPEPLVMRMASSAAHVMGRPLASSESATWLREHWKVALAYVKPELDSILVSGINHIFYHGAVFSPQDAAWPGWLFYASTQFNPNNTWWDDFGALNRYVARVQSILQRGRPDNDILLYWPLADVWDNPDGLAKMLTVHDVKFLTEQPVGKLAHALTARGYTFDYVSDAQLQQTRPDAGELVTSGNSRYKVIVVPATRRMPVATLEKLAALAAAGAKVIFEKLPEDVPGYGRLAERRAAFQTTLTSIKPRATVAADIPAAVAPLPGVRREALADTGLSFVRRATAEGRDYFVTNLGAKAHEGWVSVGPAARVLVMNPVNGHFGFARSRPAADGTLEIFLQVAPGESFVLRATRTAPAAKIAPWFPTVPAAAPIPLTGTWKLTFAKGGPELPPALETTALKSWTDLGGDEAKRFGGTARYRLEFDFDALAARHPDKPTGANAHPDWLLDLGDVRESARVILNGKEVAVAWSLPFRVRLATSQFKPGKNVLELDVTNLAANRIRYLDQQKVNWKIMREINFVNINYKPFDASAWPLTPSGLLGPITLTPLRLVAP